MTGKDSQEAEPGEARIHLLDYWSRHGHSFSAHASPEDARAELAEIARDLWENLPTGGPPQENMTDEEVIEYYFGVKGDPDVGYEIVALDNPHFSRQAGKGNG